MTNGTALGITFDGNGSYLGQQLNEVSATSFQDQAESGLAVITATSVTLTPQKWTCDGPDPVETDNYVLTGNNLTLTGPAGVIVLEKDTSPTTTTGVISFGCFTATGFVAHQLLPVTDQSGGSRCVDTPSNRYFNVHWEIDNGTASSPLPALSCSQAPTSHVELTTTASQQNLRVGVSCQDGTLYNFVGSTVDSLPPGTVASMATLVSDSDGTILSTASTPQTAITLCSGVDFQVQFPITPGP